MGRLLPLLLLIPAAVLVAGHRPLFFPDTSLCSALSLLCPPHPCPELDLEGANGCTLVWAHSAPSKAFRFTGILGSAACEVPRKPEGSLGGLDFFPGAHHCWSHSSSVLQLLPCGSLYRLFHDLRPFLTSLQDL